MYKLCYFYVVCMKLLKGQRVDGESSKEGKYKSFKQDDMYLHNNKHLLSV